MRENLNNPLQEKMELHAHNKHRERYNFKELIQTFPELAEYVHVNNFKNESIDFSDSKAVLCLNKALLKHDYGIEYWNIPSGYLCPPIPGRAEYIHQIAGFLGSTNRGKIPKGEKIRCLDIGVGANCIYPIIGVKEYGWSFVGSDIDTIALQSAQAIVEKNSSLLGKIELRLQPNATDTLIGIINNDEYYDLTICNPPFHSSAAAAEKGTLRKLSNLKNQRVTKPELNFGGLQNELWCEGGEAKFLSTLILQSRHFATSSFWYSSLVSNQKHLDKMYHELKIMGAFTINTILLNIGNKTSRIVAWTFLNEKQQSIWQKARWNG